MLIFKAILKIGEISHDKRNIKNKNGVARANNLKNDDSNMAAIQCPRQNLDVRIYRLEKPICKGREFNEEGDRGYHG